MNTTANELLDACRAAMTPKPGKPEDGITLQELRDQLGVGYVQARRVLRELIAQGTAEPVKVSRMRMSGILSKTDGYRLKP